MKSAIEGEERTAEGAAVPVPTAEPGVRTAEAGDDVFMKSATDGAAERAGAALMPEGRD